MAGKPKSMSQIKQLILLHAQGKGKKTIARTLSMSKNTVKIYLQKLESLLSDNTTPASIETLVKLEDPLLEAKFHAGNPAYKKETGRYDRFKEQLPYFLKELQRKGVTRHLLWQEYKEQYPGGYSYGQFCFHLQQQRIASKPSMVLFHKPADKLFIDFAGKKIYYTDRQTGEVVPCYLFVACLPFSDYGFAIAVPTQTIADFLYALACCLIFLGGVPASLVPDNLKAAVIRANRYEPTINRALEDFANYYGTVVIPARAKKPKDKALVENQVNIFYTRVFAKLRNQTFFDLGSLNKAITEKVREHNQTRMQEKPWCREERFLAEEKQHLMPVPEEPFELKYYTRLLVAKNNHIRLSADKHYYSVPYKLIGQRVDVYYTRTMVYIFSKGEQVAVHIRSYQSGGYTINKEHLCSHHQHYLDRSPEYYIGLATKQSEVLRELTEALFSQREHPERFYRTCDGLLSLARKTDKQTFERACTIALDNGIYSYQFVKNCIENKTVYQTEEPVNKPLPAHQNIRGKNYFTQLEINFNHQNKN